MNIIVNASQAIEGEGDIFNTYNCEYNYAYVYTESVNSTQMWYYNGYKAYSKK